MIALIRAGGKPLGIGGDLQAGSIHAVSQKAKKDLFRSSTVQPAGCQRGNANTDMCDKCVELDVKIKRYWWIASMITDQLTLHRVEVLIAQLESRKATLHPAQG